MVFFPWQIHQRNCPGGLDIDPGGAFGRAAACGGAGEWTGLWGDPGRPPWSGKCWISAKNCDEQPGFQMISGDLAMNNLGFQMILPCDMEISGDLCIIDWEENLKILNLRSKIWSLNLKELDTHTHINIYIYISIKQHRDLKGFGHE